MKPLGRQHTLRTRNSLAEQGIEMTVEQVTAERKAAYATIRKEMCKRGYDVPDSDEELFALMQSLNLPPEGGE